MAAVHTPEITTQKIYSQFAPEVAWGTEVDVATVALGSTSIHPLM